MQRKLVAAGGTQQKDNNKKKDKDCVKHSYTPFYCGSAAVFKACIKE